MTICAVYKFVTNTPGCAIYHIDLVYRTVQYVFTGNVANNITQLNFSETVEDVQIVVFLYNRSIMKNIF